MRIRTLRVVLGISLFAVVIGAVWGVWWSAQPDPRFSVEKITGLTPDDVIRRFGAPPYDPRLEKNGGWTPALEPKYGPLIFNYVEHRGWLGWEHGIVFENGHVVKVLDGSK